MAAPKSSKGSAGDPSASAEAPAQPEEPKAAASAASSPDAVPAKQAADKPPAPAPKAEPLPAFVKVTPAHGLLSHDGQSFKPGETITMGREDAAALGSRVKPAE